ncbi:MAG: hypothetical protein QUS07_00700 [Methanothrix sp.]|nr:hypothetical protein [Methanothrix sp.]
MWAVRSHARPLQGHGHAHIFCECNPGPERGCNGEVTHVTIYAPTGFASSELEVLQRLRDVWGAGARSHLIGAAGLWLAGGLRWLLPAAGQVVRVALPDAVHSTRHPKVTRAGEVKRDARGLQIGGPEHELRRLLGLAGFPEPLAVETVAGTSLGGRGGTVAGVLVQEGERRGKASGLRSRIRISNRVP